MMIKTVTLVLLLGCALPVLPQDGALTQAALETAASLRDEAMKGLGAYEILESLTTEVGPRRAGTPGDRAAVAWGVAKLKALGFDRVRTEKVTFPYWIRGEEHCEVMSPFPQPLHITGLGTSVGTPDEGIEAEIVEVPNLQALTEKRAADVTGKIVFINNRMERTKSGKGYGQAVVARASGASEAAKLGARALLIRSVGTDNHRLPHTGVMRYEKEVPKIPAAALSNPDANLLANMLRRGEPVVVRLKMTSRDGGTAVSYNVIGDIIGREKPKEVVVIGGHLDSWDLGTGAIDDGAGIAITMEAARLIGALPQRPRRTIRVILFANEESGLFGGRAYAEAHKHELDRHIIGSESDFGAGRVYEFRPRVDAGALPTMAQIGKVLEPLGIEMGDNDGWGGPDLSPLRKAGMPVATLRQDGTDYFDVHHTADDTLDKVDPVSLAQNVAAYVVFAYLAAEAPIQFRALEPAPHVVSQD